MKKEERKRSGRRILEHPDPKYGTVWFEPDTVYLLASIPELINGREYIVEFSYDNDDEKKVIIMTGKLMKYKSNEILGSHSIEIDEVVFGNILDKVTTADKSLEDDSVIKAYRKEIVDKLKELI